LLPPHNAASSCNNDTHHARQFPDSGAQNYAAGVELKRKPKASDGSSREMSRLVSIDNILEELEFLWLIDIVEPTYDGCEPRYLGVGGKRTNDIVRVWLPPNRAKQFAKFRGRLYRWRRIGSELLDNVPRQRTVQRSIHLFPA
jgi:hypothetical protein